MLALRGTAIVRLGRSDSAHYLLLTAYRLTHFTTHYFLPQVYDPANPNPNPDPNPNPKPQVYDPAKKWDSYTIHGAETYGEGTSSTLSQHGVMRTV